MNTCYNALDRHVEAGHGDRLALIYDSPVTSTIEKFTYQGVLDLVARCAGSMAGLGISKGDRIIIYMPMVPEAVISMLACARIGAIHSVVFGGFAAPELATRIDDAKPKLVITASCGIEVNRVIPYKPLLDRAIEIAGAKPEKCVILQRPQLEASLVPGRDVTWDEFISGEPAPCVPWQQPIPSIYSTPRGPPASPKGSCGTTGATWLPSPGP